MLAGMAALRYLEIAERLERSLRGGAWRPGARLPSVRELGRTWDASITTVAAAYRLLERRGLVEARAQSAAKVVPRLIAAGVRRFRVELVWESAAESRAVLDAWSGLLAGRLGPEELTRRVAAHEQFGVTAGTMRTMAAR